MNKILLLVKIDNYFINCLHRNISPENVVKYSSKPGTYEILLQHNPAELRVHSSKTLVKIYEHHCHLIENKYFQIVDNYNAEHTAINPALFIAI